MINPVANPTPSTPARPYHTNHTQKPRYHTVSTLPGEESGGPGGAEWGPRDIHRAALSTGQSGIGGKCARLARCETSPRTARASSTG